jgi:putative transposase
VIIRNRTPSEYIGYGLYLYFSGLSLRRSSEILSYLFKRNHVSIWNWIQKYQPRKISSKRKRISEFIVDEILLKVGSGDLWLWVAIDPENKEVLALSVSKERNMLIAERFLSELAKAREKHQFQRMEVIGIRKLADS